MSEEERANRKKELLKRLERINEEIESVGSNCSFCTCGFNDIFYEELEELRREKDQLLKELANL